MVKSPLSGGVTHKTMLPAFAAQGQRRSLASFRTMERLEKRRACAAIRDAHLRLLRRGDLAPDLACLIRRSVNVDIQLPCL